MGGLSFSKLLSWGVFNKGKWIVKFAKICYRGDLLFGIKE